MKDEALKLFTTFTDLYIESGCEMNKQAIACCRQMAIKSCKILITELEQLIKPEYATFILKHTVFNVNSSVVKEDAVLCDGYEKIGYWEEIILELEQIK